VVFFKLQLIMFFEGIRSERPMRRFIGDRAKLGYHTHYVVDGGQARIILAALVTPASILEFLSELGFDWPSCQIIRASSDSAI
jgi:hypothetical protein